MKQIKEIREKDLEKLSHKDQVRFALFCAYQVENWWKDIPECVEAAKITELWLEGKATTEECRQIADSAYRIADNICDVYNTNSDVTTINNARAIYSIANATISTTISAYSVAHAANAAYRAYNVASFKIIKAQWDYYDELLNFEKNFEKIVLGV